MTRVIISEKECVRKKKYINILVSFNKNKREQFIFFF